MSPSRQANTTSRWGGYLARAAADVRRVYGGKITYASTFVTPVFPYNDNPLYDLDRDNFSLVKSYTEERSGISPRHLDALERSRQFGRKPSFLRRELARNL